MILEEQIQKCIDQFLTLKEDNEIIREIGKVIAALNAKEMELWHGNELSRAATKLSILLINLGQYASECRMRYNQTYTFRKFKTSQMYMEAQGSQGDRKALADQQTNELYNVEVFENFKAESISTLYKDIERLVTVIQSRIRQLISEQIQVNLSAKESEKLV